MFKGLVFTFEIHFVYLSNKDI